MALLVCGAELIGFARSILGNNATGARSIVTAPGAALLVRGAGLPNRLIGRRTNSCNFTARNLAEAAATLLVRGAELVGVARAVLHDATCARSVVATSGATLLVRGTGVPNGLIGRRTGARKLAACDFAEAATTLLVCGAKLVRIARSILRHATCARSVVATPRGTLLVRGAGLPVSTISPFTGARHLTAGHIAMCSPALLMGRTELVGIACTVDRYTSRARSVIATSATAFLMCRTSLPNGTIGAGTLARDSSSSHVAERAATLLVRGAELV
jgi:hypothetical protein